MNPSFVVLVAPSEAAPQTVRYASGMGAALQVHLILLHLYHAPSLLMPEQALAMAGQTDRQLAETTAGMQQVGRQLPEPADVQVSTLPWPEAVEQAVREVQPLLLVLGLRPEHNFLDHLLHNHLLPVLRTVPHPLLLVPEATTAFGRPRRVLLAIDAEPCRLPATSRALAPLLASWQAAYTVVHVLPEPESCSNHPVLAHVRASGLLPPDAPLWLYQEPAASSAAGILQALVDTQADLLILLARPRSFLGSLFHHSVTAEVLRHCPVPVLLVPVAAPEQPAWMPTMS